RASGCMKVEDALPPRHIWHGCYHTKLKTGTTILYVHRKLADGDLYFLDNRNDRDDGFDAIFRIEDKAAELWHPDTGQIEPASYQSTSGRTTVPLRLQPWGTVFVVVRHPAKATSRIVPGANEQDLAPVEVQMLVACMSSRG